MKEKYRKQIRQFAEQDLKIRLEQYIDSYYDDILEKIEPIINKEINNFPLPDESSFEQKNELGSELQRIGMGISEKLFNNVLEQTIEFIEPVIKIREENLRREKLRADRSKNALKKVKQDIQNGYTGKREYWRESETKDVDQAECSENTQDESPYDEISYLITWILFKIRKIMSPFMNFINRDEFFNDLGIALSKEMFSEEKQDKNKKILYAVLAVAEKNREEWQSGIDDYFKNKIKVINDQKVWISAIKEKSIL